MAKRKVSGIFLLDKPEGISSSGALVKCRGIFSAMKGGHTGALDPLASGLLPICLGDAAKFSSFFLEGRKRYIAEGTLGKTTTTCDREGEIVLERDIGDALERLESVLEKFRGTITQVPPIYSAIKVNGKALYQYARQGREDEIEIPKREVEILELKLLETTATTFKIEVYCSKGTYIRTLVSDIGEALGCGAYVTMLRRTYVEGLPAGKMTELATIKELADSRENKSDFSELDKLLIPVDEALNNLPKVHIPLSMADPLSHGMKQGKDLSLCTLPEGGLKANDIFQVRYNGYFMGVCYLSEDGYITPKRMMDPESFAAFVKSESKSQFQSHHS